MRILSAEPAGFFYFSRYLPLAFLDAIKHFSDMFI